MGCGLSFRLMSDGRVHEDQRQRVAESWRRILWLSIWDPITAHRLATAKGWAAGRPYRDWLGPRATALVLALFGALGLLLSLAIPQLAAAVFPFGFVMLWGIVWYLWRVLRPGPNPLD